MENNLSIKDIIENLVLVARDCNLSPAILSRYEKGMILKENDYCIANYMIGGIDCSCRFAILSNQFKEIASVNKNQKGLCMANKNSRFKVLDIFNIDGKTQITLLHLPDDERWENFENMTYIIEQKLILFAKRNFEVANSIPPLPRDSEEYFDYFKKPVGFDENGVLIPYK